MGERIRQWAERRAARRANAVYVLQDSTLGEYNRGVGTLSVDGEIVGHLACIVGRLGLAPSEPWPWFVVVWTDGSKEPPFEDYGPGWRTVRELDDGYLDHHEKGVITEKRILGGRSVTSRAGASRRFEFAWLPKQEAAAAWQRLGLSEDDF